MNVGRNACGSAERSCDPRQAIEKPSAAARVGIASVPTYAGSASVRSCASPVNCERTLKGLLKRTSTVCGAECRIAKLHERILRLQSRKSRKIAICRPQLAHAIFKANGSNSRVVNHAAHHFSFAANR